LEDLTIFEGEPSGSTKFFETDISDQIQFKLKTFVIFLFAEDHEPNLQRFVTSQNQLMFTGIYLFDPDLMQRFHTNKSFMNSVISSMMSIRKSIQDYEGTHVNHNAPNELALIVELNQMPPNNENLALYNVNFSFSEFNGFPKVRMINLCHRYMNWATFLRALNILRLEVSELHLSGHLVPLDVWKNFIYGNTSSLSQTRKIKLNISPIEDLQFFRIIAILLPNLKQLDVNISNSLDEGKIKEILGNIELSYTKFD
jgi:hypothetical protein